MSKDLLQVGTRNIRDVKYIRLPDITSNIMSALIYEHDRNLYIGIYNDSQTFRILKFNMLTQQISLFKEYDKSSFGNNTPGGMIIDDNENIYIKNISYNNYYLYRKNLINDNETNYYCDYNNDASRYPSANGKLMWYDKDNICYANRSGYTCFNINTKKYTHHLSSTSIGEVIDFDIGNNVILSIRSTSVNPMINVFDKTSDVFTSFQPATNAKGALCFDGDNLFYIAQQNYLTIYDETSKTVVNSISVGWTDIRSIQYINGILYALRWNSNIMYMYDLSKKLLTQIFLQWTIPFNLSYTIRPIVFNNFYLLPYIKLGIIDTHNDIKYEFGYKNNNVVMIYNNSNKTLYDYNTNTIEFNDTYLTIKDTVISKELINNEENPLIKYAHVSKSEYNVLKSTSMHKKNKGDDY